MKGRELTRKSSKKIKKKDQRPQCRKRICKVQFFCRKFIREQASWTPHWKQLQPKIHQIVKKPKTAGLQMQVSKCHSPEIVENGVTSASCKPLIRKKKSKAFNKASLYLLHFHQVSWAKDLTADKFKVFQTCFCTIN